MSKNKSKINRRAYITVDGNKMSLYTYTWFPNKFKVNQDILWLITNIIKSYKTLCCFHGTVKKYLHAGKNGGLIPDVGSAVSFSTSDILGSVGFCKTLNYEAQFPQPLNLQLSSSSFFEDMTKRAGCNQFSVYDVNAGKFLIQYNDAGLELV